MNCNLWIIYYVDWWYFHGCPCGNTLFFTQKCHLSNLGNVLSQIAETSPGGEHSPGSFKFLQLTGIIPV
jgi:hypothetical protein